MDLKRRSLGNPEPNLTSKLIKGKPKALQEERGSPRLIYRLISVLLAAVMLINCSLVSSVVQNTPSESDQGQNEIVPASPPTPIQAEVVPVPSPQLPAPPAPLEVSLQNPEQEANSLANALAGPDNLAAWLGLYHALGIPVIGENRTSIDGSDDPIGPPYWQVWYTASLDLPGHGIQLADAGRLLGLAFGLNPDNSQTMGDTLLSDLRSALDSQDSAVRLMGAVARERVLRSGSKLDLLDGTTTAQTASIDVPMLQLIFWVVLRGALLQHSAQSANPSDGTVLISNPLQAFVIQTGTFNCSEAYGDADSTYWTNWIVAKAFGGVQLPGMTKALPGLLEKALTQVGMNADTFAATNKALGWANVVGGAVSFLMQIASLDLVGIQDPDKLVRNKSTDPGKNATVTWRLMSDPGKLPNGNGATQCFLSFISNILGAGFSFPAQSTIAGAELTFKGGMNIPERVRFADYKQLRSWTNQNGEADLKMEGSPRKKDLSNKSPRAVDEEYSVFVSAQPEEAGLNSMANIFFGGLVFGASPGPAGLISSLIDILKTFSYDMGEHVFPITDWMIGYNASGGQGIDIIGTICGGLNEPFQLEGLVADGSHVVFAYEPANENGGSYTYSGSGGGFSFSGSGTYSIAGTDSDVLLLTQTDTRGCMQVAGGGCKEYTNTVTLTPIESCPP